MCSYLIKVGSTYRFRRPVPKDIIAQGLILTASGKPRTEWNISLNTKDHETAKRLRVPHIVDTDRQIDEARAKMKQATRTDPAAQAREREEAAAMAALAAESQARREARSELRTLWHNRRATSTAMLTQEEAAAIDLIRERDAELEQLRAAIAVMEKDKYGPAFQAEQAEAAAKQRAKQFARLAEAMPPAASITGLYERYARSGSANPKTVARWRPRVASFVEYLGHDDVTRVSRGDLNKWVETLIAKGLAKKTVADGYLPPVKVILGLAYDDELIPSNPSSGLKVRGPSAVMVRDRDLTDDEALTILRGTLQPQSDRLSPEHALARRWVPWLCAYTGARVAEMTQLRAGDIRQEQGVWVVHVTPEAGSTKDGKARRVPLHPHLIEQGITKLAKPGDNTPLFYREGAGNEVNPAPKMRATDLSDWVRSLGVTDPNVQPNHGWRHRFKTQARVEGIPEELADRIQGHAPKHQGGKYGKGALPVNLLLAEIEKIPPYQGHGLPPFTAKR